MLLGTKIFRRKCFLHNKTICQNYSYTILINLVNQLVIVFFKKDKFEFLIYDFLFEVYVLTEYNIHEHF